MKNNDNKMSVEIKKEDTEVDFIEFKNYEFEEAEGCDDSDESDKNFKKTSKTVENEKVIQATPIDMPTKEEIMNIKDLQWRMSLQRYIKTQELQNDCRTKVAKVIIRNIHERKFQLHGNYDLK